MFSAPDSGHQQSLFFARRRAYFRRPTYHFRRRSNHFSPCRNPRPAACCGDLNAAVSTSLKRVVLVTGAAGGLGSATVNGFAADGWQVVAASHGTPPFWAAENIWGAQLDVTDRTCVGAVFE